MTSAQAKQLLTDPNFLAFAAGKKMEWRYDTGWREFSAMLSEDFIDKTNRIRIALEPARVPLEAKDWDGPVWWVNRPQDTGMSIIMGIGTDGILIAFDCRMTEFSWHQLMEQGWERSRDRVTWTPCWKEAP